MSRRAAARLVAQSAAGFFFAPISLTAEETKLQKHSLLRRAIPSSGEMLPVIGLGSWQVFDVDLKAENEKQLGDVLSSFVKLGGRVVDSSPMYGRSEQVIGQLAANARQYRSRYHPVARCAFPGH